MAKRKKEIEVIDADELEKAEGKKIKPKKKKRKCLRCCLAFLITVIVILAAGIGVGCYFGNKILKEQFDVGLSDTFKVLRNFKNYRKVERNELKNTYAAGDSDKFVDSLTTAILLNDNVSSAEVKDLFTDIITDLLDSKDNGEAESGKTEEEDSKEVKKAQILSDAQEESQKSPTDKFLELFVLENMNIERINAYTGEEDLENYYLRIKDKELAAFMNELFPVLIDKLELDKTVKEALADFTDLDVDIKELISLKQITFYKDGDIPRMSMIIKVKPRSVTDQAIKGTVNPDYIFGKEKGNGFLRWCVKAGGTIGKGVANLFFIPKTLYITADLELSVAENQKTLNPIIKINSTTQNDIKTLDKFSDGAVTKQFDEIFAVSGGVGSIIKSLNDAVPMDKEGVVENNSISVDAIQLAFDMLFKDNVTSDTPVMTADFLSSLWPLGVDTEAAMTTLQNPDYKNVRFVRDENGKVIFNEDGTPKTEGAIAGREATVIEADYKSAVVEAFTKYFGLSASFEDLMDALLDSDTDALTEMFDAKAVQDMANTPDNGGRLTITDEMMAAIIAYTKEKLLKDVNNESITAETFEPRYVLLSESNGHNFLEIGIQLNINKIIVDSLSGGGIVVDMLKGLLPQSMLVMVKIDITLDKSIEPFDNVVAIDTWSGAKTAAMFVSVNRLLTALGSAEFSIDSMISQLSNAVKTVIDSLNSVLPIRIGESKIIMPDVFEAIASILNIENVSGIEVRDSLKFLINGYDDSAESADKNFEGNSEEFLDAIGSSNYDPMSQFRAKYAIETSESYGFTNFMDDILDVNFKDGFMDLIYVSQLKTLAADTYVEGVEIDASLLYSILEYKLGKQGEKEGNKNAYDFDISDVVLVKMYSIESHNYAEITLLLEPAKLIGEDDSPKMNLFKDILSEKIYVTLLIDITLDILPDNKISDIYFNGNDAKTESVLKLLQGMGVGIRDNLNTIIADLEVMFAEALNGMNDSGVVNAEFKTDRFITNNIFEAIANVVKTDGVDGDGMHVVLDCLLNDSDNEIPNELDFTNYYKDANGKPVHGSDSGATDIKVDFEAVLFDEFMKAYPLNGNDKDYANDDANDAVEDLEELTGILSDGNSNELAKKIDSDKFEESVFVPYVELHGVVIDSLLLAGMIESRWETIKTDYELKYTKIYSFANRYFVAMAIQIPLGELGLPQNVLGLLESKNVLVALIVDVTDTTQNNDYLAFDINLAGDEKSADVIDVIEKFNKGAIDFEEIGNSVRKVFTDLGNSAGMEFKTIESYGNTVDVMAMPNIFDLIVEMSYKGEFKNGVKVQAALQGIHLESKYNTPYINSGVEFIRNGMSATTIDLDTYFAGQIPSAAEAASTGEISVGMLDSDLGKFIYQEGKGGEGKEAKDYGFGEIESFTILKGSKDAAEEEKDWVNDYYGGTKTLEFDNDYVSIGFKMELSKFGIRDALANKMLPSEFHATIILPLVDGRIPEDTENSTVIYEYFRINNLNEATQGDLFTLFCLTGEAIENILAGNLESCYGVVNDTLDDIDKAIADSITSSGFVVNSSVNFLAPYDGNNAIGKYMATMQCSI